MSIPMLSGRFRATHWLVTALLAGGAAARGAEPAPPVAFEPGEGQLAITVGGEPFATYVYQDPAITRPYFAHVRTTSGVQVTRNHPPQAGSDSPDHATFHPGVWMSFGDINGSDYWRLAAPVKFDKFTAEPAGGAGRGAFAIRYNYLDQQTHEPVCREDFRCDIRATPAGCLLMWDSTFSSDKRFAFGDQEEMGLGFRVATPIRAERQSDIGLPPGNGQIIDSAGRRNEDQIWGNSAEWADYSGELDGQLVGIALFPHPENFRPSWFHARDYGMMAANPFGRQAFGKGEKSQVTVEPGQSLRLRYGVLIHSSPAGQQVDLADAYQAYLQLSGR